MAEHLFLLSRRESVDGPLVTFWVYGTVEAVEQLAYDLAFQHWQVGITAPEVLSVSAARSRLLPLPEEPLNSDRAQRSVKSQSVACSLAHSTQNPSNSG